MEREKTTSPPIALLPGLAEEQAARLRTHGIRDVRFFLALTQIHESHAGLRRLLGCSESKMDRWAAGARDLLGEEVAHMTPKPIGLGQLGCALREQGRSPEPEDPQGTPRQPSQRLVRRGTPSEIDLIDRFGSVRDQGMRGTCVAHAFAAAREFILDANSDLSEQFLYWDCKQRDGHPGPGTYMSTAVECLEKNGICQETTWPYNPEPTDDEGQGPPPPDAEEEATDFTIRGHACLRGFGVGDLKAFLAYGEDGSGHPFTFAVPVFPSWGNAETSRTGFVPEEFDGEQPIGHHALACCGYFDDSEAPGGGYFVFRNSWGTSWAYESYKGAGYGFLSYAYMQRNARDCYALPASKTARRRPSRVPVRLSPTLAGAALALAIFVFGGDWLGPATQAEASRSANRTTTPVDRREFSEERALQPQEASAEAAGSSQRHADGDTISIGERVRQIWQRILVALDTLQSV